MNLEKIVFMLNKFRADLISAKQPYRIALDLPSKTLGDYYFKFSENPSQLNKLIAEFDKDGIPLNRTYIDVEDVSLHYYPISIGQYGLAVYQSYLSGNEEKKRQHFLHIADWFMKNRCEDHMLGSYWLTHVPKPEYHIIDAWKSAFTQSRALSILLRAWQMTNENKYLEVATKALIPFTRDICDGGVTANLYAGHPFYEEYVAAEPTMVLDGHIFSLFGLYDYVRAIPKDQDNHQLALSLFEQGIESLLYYMPDFDMNYWLRFNLCRMPHYPKVDPCTVGYLRLVKIQLEVLYQITGNENLKNWYLKIDKYDSALNILRMYRIKFKVLKNLNRL